MQPPNVIVLPGYEDSGPDHWQSRWCREHPEYRRITGLDWHEPQRDDWVVALGEAVAEVRGPVVIAAHSLGSVAVATWGSDAPPSVAGALLVTPCDTEQDGFPANISGFVPMPYEPLPFPSTLVASRSDPWTRFYRAEAFADAWGSRLVDAGEVGHLNVAAGYGPWPAGEALLAELLGRP